LKIKIDLLLSAKQEQDVKHWPRLYDISVLFQWFYFNGQVLGKNEMMKILKLIFEEYQFNT
jgi:hypothetical protein